MNWTRTILDGFIMCGYFNFGIAVLMLARPLMMCKMYPREIGRLVTPEAGHIKRVLIYIYGLIYLPMLTYGVLSAYEAGINGFWHLFWTAYIELFFVNLGDFFGLDLLFREKMGKRLELPGTEGHECYGRKLWMKKLAVPDHWLVWPFLFIPALSAVSAGIGILIR